MQRIMDNKLVWNLKDIYENQDLFDEDVKEFQKISKEILSMKGTLKEGSNKVLECYKKLDKALELEEKLYGYAMLNYHKDMSKTDSIKLYKKIEKIATDFSEEVSFISPELSKIDDSDLKRFLEENEELRNEYRKSIEDTIKSKKHILSEEVEKVLAKYSEIFGAYENTYEIFTNTELDFPDIVNKNGKKLKVTHGTFSKYLMDKDVSVRKQAFESMYSLYKKHENTITELYLSRVKETTISAKLRNYESSLDAATDADDSNVKVYETLLKEVNKNLDLNREYIKLKRDLLTKEEKTDEFHIYDVYVNTLNPEEKDIPYEEGKEIVLKALAPMGEDYINMLKYAFENNWLDVYETENKRSGGYSMGIHTVHPYILLNYTNSSRDVSTVAHELGHTMHSYYASKSQNIINANYTIMVAEVASTVNEILLANYLIKNETDSNKKAALINDQLDTIRATLYRQAMFAEFEKDVHSKIEQGETLTSENLDSIYYELVKKYFGDAVIFDEEIKYEWARIPHFYSCFYVYKYATGITSAIVIASNILEGKEGYVERYIEMLKKGGSIGSLELLKMVDVDLEKEETYEKAFNYFRKNLEELKGLISK
jgi:oligoendopeptidase F